MATFKEIVDREKDVSDKLSTQVRALSVGLIVFVWTVFNSTAGTAAALLKNNSFRFLAGIGVLSFLALAADFVQYVCAEIVVGKVFRDPRNTSSGNYQYDTDWYSYKAQNWAFWAKQGLCGLALVLTLIVAIVQICHEICHKA